MRIGKALYFDHQATTPLDPQVLAVMEPYLRDEFGNPHSSEHAFGWRAHQAMEKAAEDVGRLVGADADEIVFTSGATEANNLALLGSANTEVRRRRILIGSIDHKSSLAVGRVLSERGFETCLVRVDNCGRIDEADLRAKLDDNVLLASLCVVNSEIGTIQNVSSLSALLRSKGAMLHLDAAQAPATMATSPLGELADFISLSAHKMYGPKGIGALIVNRSQRQALKPIIHGGGQQSNLRSGTLPTALCAGFGAAAKIIMSGDGANERARIGCLRAKLWQGLQSLREGMTLNGPEFAERHTGNLNIRLSGISGHDLIAVLQPRLAVSTGSACTSGTEEPSHVLTAIGLTAEEADSSIRLCVGRFTTQADVAQAVTWIDEAINRLSVAPLGSVG